MTAALIVAAALVGGATAAELPPLTGKDVDVRVKDSKGPQRFYPEAALKKGVEGRASALCVVADNGDLTTCEAISETPVGAKFGEAAARMASTLRVGTTTRNGDPTVGRRFQFDMNFKLPRF